MKIIALIQKNSLLVLLGTSVPYIVGYLCWKHLGTPPENFANSIWTSFYDIALTLFGSGIFLATLKYFQFLGFFLDEINKALYSDDYLKKQKGNIYPIWQRVTKVLLESELPDSIVDNMLYEISNKFLTKGMLDHYYKTVDVRYVISIDTDGYVSIEEWIYYKIINKDKEPINFKYGYFISLKNPTDSNSSIQLQYFRINDFKIEPNDSNLQAKRDENRLYLSYAQILENLPLCEIEHQINFKQSIKIDREFYYKSKNIVEDMTVTIENKTPDKLGIILVEMGISTFKKSNTNTTDIYKGAYILPNNGFRLFFHEKDQY